MFNVVKNKAAETENSPHTARQKRPTQKSGINLATVGSKMKKKKKSLY
jgi:hypothetical protein